MSTSCHRVRSTVTGMWRRGSWLATLIACSASCALIAPLVPAPDASAAPQLGRWEGEGKNGAQVRFEVMRERGSANRAITYFTLGCTFESVGPDFNNFADSRGDGGVAPGDTLRPNSFPVTRTGRVGDAKGAISPTLRGRLGTNSGTINVKGAGCDPGVVPNEHLRVRVRRVSAALERPISGVWHVSIPPLTDFRFEVFGWGLNYFYGNVFTGIGLVRGVPTPCVRTLGFIDAGASIPTWIGTDGAFLALDDTPGAEARFDGRFESEGSASGTYHVNSGFLNHFYLHCVDTPFPFTAQLEDPAPPPKLHGAPLVDDSGPPPPPPEPGPALPAPSQPAPYVALGDSYSSGEGVPPFRDNKACHRSTRSYPYLLNPPGYTMQTASFACSGAVTENVGRLSGGVWTGTPQNPGEGTSQLERLSLEQWRPTELITLTIGGNDAHFGKVIARCIIRFAGCHKGKAAEQTKRRIAEVVPGLLDAAYAAIRSRVPMREEPNATVVVLGYPQLFPDRPHGKCRVQGSVVSPARWQFLRERGEQLNAVIQELAAAHSFHFVSVEKTFKGHEICGRDKSWLHGLKLPHHKYSYHPTARGQQALSDALVGYLSCLYTSGYRFRDSGIPFVPGTAGQVVPADCVSPG